MIQFTYRADGLDVIRERLGELAPKAKTVLARAANDTAKKAKAMLADKARETYMVKKGGITKAMKLKSATASKPEAIIRVTGKPIELKQFKVNPASYNPSNRPKTTKAKVLAASSLKPLEKNHIKAFIVKYASGHVAVATRTSMSQYPIKNLYSVSIPKMIGSEQRVYGVLKPHIMRIFDENVDRQIRRVLRGFG